MNTDLVLRLLELLILLAIIITPGGTLLIPAQLGVRKYRNQRLQNIPAQKPAL